ncbi:hypothetical protein L21SP3_00029 [Sedimentisphaera cyanobacteriorum]|uniref:Uncharacterized protein n=1 Tax=Sedimentisphaera cyanobacteriorum TaxID=1940790 RepID=A0A1Q2HM09_9BACT|nr:hypothetical protein [Sedimentisphaera cyanobacteriorum]AQQ08253.1 hypothetical protein L21SP3_00029 [Sedimentisphaera cyanobacteriorum]
MKAKLLTISTLLIAAAVFASPKQQDWGEKKWQPERGRGGPYMQQKMQHYQKQMPKYQPRMQQNWRRQAQQYRPAQQRMQGPRAYHYRRQAHNFQQRGPAENFKKQRFFEAVKRRAMQNPEFRKRLSEKMMSKAWQAKGYKDAKCPQEQGRCPQDKIRDKKGPKQQGRFEGKQDFRPRKNQPMQGQRFRDEKGFRKEKHFAPRQGRQDKRMQRPMPYAGKDHPRAMMQGKMMDRPLKFKCPHCGRVITKEMVIKNRKDAQNPSWKQKRDFRKEQDSHARKAHKGEMKKECNAAEGRKMKGKGYRDKDECDDSSEQKRRQRRNKHQQKRK